MLGTQNDFYLAGDLPLSSTVDTCNLMLIYPPFNANIGPNLSGQNSEARVPEGKALIYNTSHAGKSF
jgi:hypothetical protein